MNPDTRVILTFPMKAAPVLLQQGIRIPLADVNAQAQRVRLTAPFEHVTLTQGEPITDALRARMRQVLQHFGGY
jgi:hypothetical protein